MSKSKSGGRLKTSKTQPQLFVQKESAGTEVKYFGLVRDEALSDLESRDKALAEVLKDIQSESEATSEGIFKPSDLQVLDGIVTYDLKKEDFEILEGASISTSTPGENPVPLTNPRQRISDRIAQAERFAGRGTNYQGQGAVLYKYYVPEDEEDSNGDKYSHTNPPPFFKKAVDSEDNDSPDFVPNTTALIENTHRVGYLENGKFVPASEMEYWWSGEYDRDMAQHAIYGDLTESVFTDPKFPIVRDGNMKFDQITPSGIDARYNWGLRFDMWVRRADFISDPASTVMRWVAQVNGQLRIDYFDKTGYAQDPNDPSKQIVQGAWKTALDTSDSGKHYSQVSKGSPAATDIGFRKYYVQGGPSMDLGTGTGTVPQQRALDDAGALRLNKTHLDQEGNIVKNFDNDYLPVVIRFWYGQGLLAEGKIGPPGQASFFIEMVDTDLPVEDLGKWNDYSSQLRLKRNTGNTAWKVDTSSGGSAGGEADFAKYNEKFDIIGYGSLGTVSSLPSKPSGIAGYTSSSISIVAIKSSEVPQEVTFSLPGITIASDSVIWVVARNRAFSQIPGYDDNDSGNRTRKVESMWEEYIFNPDPNGKYTGAKDLLEGLGENYVEPNPAKTSFEENLDLYKAVYGALPALNTYTSTRYDGVLPSTITTSNTQRDYDYNHSKLLMIGRQKKGTIGEIGTTAPYAGKDLQSGEVRKKGENYTFIEVVENEAGIGGNVIIEALPCNDLGVISTTSTTTYGKTLHMLDNTTTFSKNTRQNISTIALNELPTDANFPSTTAKILYEELNGQGRLRYGTLVGETFTPDSTTGVIANLTMGAVERNHENKSAFLVGFTKGSAEYSFYGLIGLLRPSFSSVSITTSSATTAVSAIAFPSSTETSNNGLYVGSRILFPGDDPVTGWTTVTAFVASTGVITFTPAKTSNTIYNGCQVYHNYFQIGGVLPSNVVQNSDLAKTSRISVLPSAGGNSGRAIQIRYVFNSAYQYLRADNGSGLSFSETLYINSATSPTEVQPFSGDTELPAPQADRVVPFGYDKSADDQENPGLGGLCYPPHSIQNVDLQNIAKTDTALYSATAGNFDVWWGSKIGGQSDMSGKYLHVTDKLIFDFSQSPSLLPSGLSVRDSLLTNLSAADKPKFLSDQYTHKLKVELSVKLPENASTVRNSSIYKDARFHSNGTSVKDTYYLFIKKQSGGNGLSVLSANSPSWT